MRDQYCYLLFCPITHLLCSLVTLFERVEGVTFTPVYRCIHIYQTLCAINEFQNYYQYTRQVSTANGSQCLPSSI